MASVTQLLIRWSRGDEACLNELYPIVERELHRIARRYMRKERPGHTLQTTALVNEAYLRLIDASQVQWQNRAHFFAVAAHLMRRILVDFARTRNYQKRGGGAQPVALDEAVIVAPERGADLLALDEALTQLQALNARQAQVVELRYFGGLSEEETSEALKISVRTVRRDWNFARVWLHRELTGRGANDA